MSPADIEIVLRDVEEGIWRATNRAGVFSLMAKGLHDDTSGWGTVIDQMGADFYERLLELQEQVAEARANLGRSIIKSANRHDGPQAETPTELETSESRSSKGTVADDRRII